jgi:hypothetical protein
VSFSSAHGGETARFITNSLTQNREYLGIRTHEKGSSFADEGQPLIKVTCDEACPLRTGFLLFLPAGQGGLEAAAADLKDEVPPGNAG